MNIVENEQDRQKKLYECVTTTHMFCLFVMLLALVLGRHLFPLNNYRLLSARLIFLIALIGLIAVLLYNSRIHLFSEEKISWLDVAYVFFPLLTCLLTILVVKRNVSEILLLPIIITASILGKIPGLICATLCTIILFVDNILDHISDPPSFLQLLESNLILICVMYIVGWFIGTHADLEKEYREQMKKIANSDVLTGLFNFSFFQEILEKQIASSSEQRPLSLIFIDVDYFKHYNDSFGHLTGDHLLITVAKVLLRTVEETGFIARYGGDEFVVLLPGYSSEQALNTAEKIRQNIKQERFSGEEYQPGSKITVSCGVATYPTHASNARELLQFADQALYRAKSLDKDGVKLYFSVLNSLEVEENEKQLINSINTLVSVINAKDRYTYGHSERVTDYSLKLGKKLGLAEKELQLLSYAAFLHDIGKIEIDRMVLNKTGQLNSEEWESLKQHPAWGSDIIRGVQKLNPAADIIIHHHENYDGTGYPRQLKGEEIPLLARIIRIADSYDAMTSQRPYKNEMSVLEALNELELCSGTCFDPELIPIFTEIIKSNENITLTDYIPIPTR